MKTLKANGLEMAVEIHGSGDPILFVHGFPLSRRLWHHAPALLSEKYTLVMPDLRGMGQSEATESATMTDYADDLAAILDATAPQKPAIVVGLSMGGYVAFEFFRRHGAKVRALVLADTKAEPDTVEAAKGRHDTAEKVLREGSGVVADAMTPKLFAKSTSTAVVEEWRAIMAATKPVGVAAALNAMASRPDSVPTLAQIKVPTLVIVGEEDAITPPANARTIHTGIEGAQLKTLPDAGHMPPVEKPAEFFGAISRFLSSLK